MPHSAKRPVDRREIEIVPPGLPGTLAIPQDASALVIFAHGSGSSRLSPRNVQVADALNRQGLATLLFDLLSPEEEDADARARVFDVELLAQRLIAAIAWIDRHSTFRREPIGLFGASTGAAAALAAAAAMPSRIGAVVSRGGRPDLADAALERVTAPTLLVVGGEDFGVIELNERALARLRCTKELVVVPGATHLFPEPGAMDQVVAHAARWFAMHLHGPEERTA